MTSPWRERVEIAGGRAVLYLGDNREVWPAIGLVDAVVTSPPYDGLREYGGIDQSDWLDVISLIAASLRNGGVCMWNVADQTVDGSETGTSFRQCLHAKACGLRIHDTMIYCKEHVTFPDTNRYHPAHEYMFVWSQGAPRHFNGIKDWRNKWRGSAMRGTRRQPDGTTRPISGTGRVIPEFGLRRNWWPMASPYNGETGDHPAPMPFEMADAHIQTWTAAGDLVADPFAGSGTAGVAAMRLGRRFVGIEIDEGYFRTACRRIAEAARQPGLLIPETAA